MKKSITVLFGLLVMIATFSTASGREYFVSADGNNKTGDGSAKRPWATLSFAMKHVEDDGSVIKVKPGLYTGKIGIGRHFKNGLVIQAEEPYRTMLRNNKLVLYFFNASNIVFRGFDIAHSGSPANVLVMQITGGNTHHITLEDNIIHDSYNNDLLKHNNGTHHNTIKGNIFYNVSRQHQAIDTKGSRDSVIEDNIFFNDYGASQREPPRTGGFAFVVFKGGSRGHVLRRNVFLNCETLDSSYGIISFGENTQTGAENILVENNLILGNASGQTKRHKVRTPFQFYSGQNIVVRHNTVTGDLPTRSGYLFWFKYEGRNKTSPQKIIISNNIFSDPTGTMGRFASIYDNTEPDFLLSNNLYWNGGRSIEKGRGTGVTDDTRAVLGDPCLEEDHARIILPLFNQEKSCFISGNRSIRSEFVRLVETYGKIKSKKSAAIDRADPRFKTTEDILGKKRSVRADIGAWEY